MIKTVIVNTEDKAKKMVDILKSQGRTSWYEVMLCKYDMKIYSVVWYRTIER